MSFSYILLGNPKFFPSKRDYIFFLKIFISLLGSPPIGWWHPADTLNKHLNLLNSHLLMRKSSSLTPNSLWMIEIKNSIPSRAMPTDEAHSAAYVWVLVLFFLIWSKTHDEEWNIDKPVNGEFYLSAEIFLHHSRQTGTMPSLLQRMPLSINPSYPQTIQPSLEANTHPILATYKFYKKNYLTSRGAGNMIQTFTVVSTCGNWAVIEVKVNSSVL